MKHFDGETFVTSDVEGFVEKLRAGEEFPTLDPAMELFHLGAPLHDILAADHKREQTNVTGPLHREEGGAA